MLTHQLKKQQRRQNTMIGWLKSISIALSLIMILGTFGSLLLNQMQHPQTECQRILQSYGTQRMHLQEQAFEDKIKDWSPKRISRQLVLVKQDEKVHPTGNNRMEIRILKGKLQLDADEIRISQMQKKKHIVNPITGLPLTQGRLPPMSPKPQPARSPSPESPFMPALILPTDDVERDGTPAHRQEELQAKQLEMWFQSQLSQSSPSRTLQEGAESPSIPDLLAMEEDASTAQPPQRPASPQQPTAKPQQTNQGQPEEAPATLAVDDDELFASQSLPNIDSIQKKAKLIFKMKDDEEETWRVLKTPTGTPGQREYEMQIELGNQAGEPRLWSEQQLKRVLDISVRSRIELNDCKLIDSDDTSR